MSQIVVEYEDRSRQAAVWIYKLGARIEIYRSGPDCHAQARARAELLGKFLGYPIVDTKEGATIKPMGFDESVAYVERCKCPHCGKPLRIGDNARLNVSKTGEWSGECIPCAQESRKKENQETGDDHGIQRVSEQRASD